jgi:RND family efflux transporter MFP subunit
MDQQAPQLGETVRTTPARTHRRRWFWGVVAVLVAGGVVAWGIVDRQDNVDQLRTLATDEAVPKVSLVQPTPGPASRTLMLPGDVDAWYQAPIYAQVTGYVEMWYADYGAQVHKGQLLATIATPDLDQQLEQARAQLDVARARYALAQVTAQRWQKLAGTQAVSQQEVDVNVADARAQKAEVDAARFNVARYEAQEAFKRIVAPFDGVVTARHTDVGNFVNATGGNVGREGGGQELFSVADIHRMRVYVSVPQDYSGYLKAGMKASLTLPQFPGRRFDASLETTSQSYSTSSRTVLTELTVANPDHDIWPGAYTEVTFTVPTRPGVVVVPEQALLFRAQGLQVALVDPATERVHLQDVTLGLNLGQTVQVVRGLKLGDRLIANPSDGLLEGERVDVVHVPPQNADDDGLPQADNPADK